MAEPSAARISTIPSSKRLNNHTQPRTRRRNTRGVHIKFETIIDRRLPSSLSGCRDSRLAALETPGCVILHPHFSDLQTSINGVPIRPQTPAPNAKHLQHIPRQVRYSAAQLRERDITKLLIHNHNGVIQQPPQHFCLLISNESPFFFFFFFSVKCHIQLSNLSILQMGI